jgi:hypothetical protein
MLNLKGKKDLHPINNHSIFSIYIDIVIVNEIISKNKAIDRANEQASTNIHFRILTAICLLKIDRV